ncbi:MAG TPA: hypothetical protein VL251_06725 [Thermomonas sp.]|jgi:hypothetical protein|nr:hypothetical protein [Thermomonas sp.]
MDTSDPRPPRTPRPSEPAWPLWLGLAGVVAAKLGFGLLLVYALWSAGRA